MSTEGETVGKLKALTHAMTVETGFLAENIAALEGHYKKAAKDLFAVHNHLKKLEAELVHTQEVRDRYSGRVWELGSTVGRYYAALKYYSNPANYETEIIGGRPPNPDDLPEIMRDRGQQATKALVGLVDWGENDDSL